MRGPRMWNEPLGRLDSQASSPAGRTPKFVFVGNPSAVLRALQVVRRVADN